MSERKTLQGLLDRAHRGSWSVQWDVQNGGSPDAAVLLTMRRDGSRSLRFTLTADALGTWYLARAAVELTTGGYEVWGPMVPSAAVAKLEARP
ncbi:hypothetical protein ACFW6R_08990 [Streptomyces albidoflavus]